MHGLDGQHQDMDRTPSERVTQTERIEMNEESVSMFCPTSDRGRLKNRTELMLSMGLVLHLTSCFVVYQLLQ